MKRSEPVTGDTGAASTHLRLANLLDRHLTLMVTVLAFMVVAVKALTISGLVVPSALVVVQEAGPVAVFLGVLLSELEIFLLVVALVVYFIATETGNRRQAWVIGAVAIAVGLVSVPWPLFSALALVVGLAAINPRLTLTIKRRSRSGSLPRTMERLDRWNKYLMRLAMGLLLFLIFLFFISGDPWLPSEVLLLDDGNHITGYVLDDSGEWTVVLIEHDRSVMRVRGADIERRTVCLQEDPPPPRFTEWAHQIDEWLAQKQSVYQILSPRPQDIAEYPDCPEQAQSVGRWKPGRPQTAHAL